MKKLLLALVFVSLPLAAQGVPRDGTPRSSAEELLVAALAKGVSRDAAGVLRIGGEQFDVFAFALGVANTGDASGGGSGAGKASFSDLAVVKRMDKSSPKLFQACVNGQHFSDAVLSISDGKGTVVAQIKMRNVLISSYQTGGSSGDLPFESLTLNFGEIEQILIGL